MRHADEYYKINIWQVIRDSTSRVVDALGCVGLLSPEQCGRVGALLNGARILEVSLNEELHVAGILRDRLSCLQKGIKRARRDQQRATSVLDQCEASVGQDRETVQQALTNCQVS